MFLGLVPAINLVVFVTFVNDHMAHILHNDNLYLMLHKWMKKMWVIHEFLCNGRQG